MAPLALTRAGALLKAGGQTVRLSGFNFYDAVFSDNISGGPGFTPMATVTAVLDAAVAMGHNAVRIHTAGIGYGKANTFMPTNGVYNEAAFVQLDKVMDACRTRGLWVMRPFTDRWNFYHGGAISFAEMMGATGTDDQKRTAFFTNSSYITAFLAYVGTHLNRTNTINGQVYKTDPTDAIYETGNEIWDVPAAWSAQVMAYLKSGAPAKLTADGSAASGETQYTKFHTSSGGETDANCDIVGAHFYDDHRMDITELQQQVAWATSASKVFLVGEYDWRNASQGTANSAAVQTATTRAQWLTALETYGNGDFPWTYTGPATSVHDDGYQLLVTTPQNSEQTAAKAALAAHARVLNPATTGTTTPPGALPNREVLRSAYRTLVASGTRTRYVAGNGSDSAAGTSTAPFATIQHALDSAVAGDRVLVRNGTYGYSQIYGKNGTASSWISIEADVGYAPVIDVSNTSNDGIDIQLSSYVGFFGFEIKASQTQSNTDTSGVAVFRGSHHIVNWAHDIHDFPGGGVNHFYVGVNTQYNLPAGGWDVADASYNTIHACCKYSATNTSGISFYGAVDTTNGATWDGKYGYRAVGNYIYDCQCLVAYTPGGFNAPTDGNGISIDSLNTANNLYPQIVPYTKYGLADSNLIAACGGRAIHTYNSINVDAPNNTAIGNLRTNSPYINGGVELDLQLDTTVATPNVRYLNSVIIPLNTPNSTDSTSIYTGSVICGGTQVVPAGSVDRRTVGAAYLVGAPTMSQLIAGVDRSALAVAASTTMSSKLLIGGGGISAAATSKLLIGGGGVSAVGSSTSRLQVGGGGVMSAAVEPYTTVKLAGQGPQLMPATLAGTTVTLSLPGGTFTLQVYPHTRFMRNSSGDLIPVRRRPSPITPDPQPVSAGFGTGPFGTSPFGN